MTTAAIKGGCDASINGKYLKRLRYVRCAIKPVTHGTKGNFSYNSSIGWRTSMELVAIRMSFLVVDVNSSASSMR